MNDDRPTAIRLIGWGQIGEDRRNYTLTEVVILNIIALRQTIIADGGILCQ